MTPLERFLRQLAREAAASMQREVLKVVKETLRESNPYQDWQRPTKPPPRPKIAPWRAALGFKRAEVVTAEMIQQRFRKLVLRHHPDKGGDPEKFKRLVLARAAGLKEVSNGKG